MHAFNFTEGVRVALAGARDEASRLRHEYVGTEHVLLGLLGNTKGGAFDALRGLNVDSAKLRVAVESTVQKGKAAHDTGPDLPYTVRAKKVLELAMLEAMEMQHSYVGTEHLLLGLLREGKGIGAQALTEAGVSLETARAEVVRLTGAARGNRGSMKASFPSHEGDGDTVQRSTRAVPLWYLARYGFLSAGALAIVFLLVDLLVPPAIPPAKSLLMAVIGGITMTVGHWMAELRAPRGR